MKRWAAMVLWFAASAAGAGEELIRVGAGQHHNYVSATKVKRVAVGDADIADVSILSRNEMLVLGKKPGVTSLLVWEHRYGGKPKTYLLQVDPMVPVADSGERAPSTGQVQVDVQIVEMSRKVLKEFGVNLLNSTSEFTVGLFAPGSPSTGTVVPNLGNLTAADVTRPFSDAFRLVSGSGNRGQLRVLAFLEQNGLAHTLARPSLVATSGQTASFMAGGEFPIPIAQSLGQVTVSYKPYGIRLNLTPTVFSKDRIAIKLAPEVSELDFVNVVSAGGVSVPGVLIRRAETTIELGDGESFIIGGLVSRNMVDNLDKAPVLGDIPILGAFFKSTRFSRQDKELVIIATPHLVRPAAAGAELPLPGAEYENYDPSWLRVLMYQKDPFAVEGAK